MHNVMNSSVKWLSIMAIVVFALAMTSCNNMQKQRDNAASSILEYENSHDALGLDYMKNPQSADSLIDMYIAFADTYPDDSLAPAFLNRAANVECLKGSFDKAIEYANRVINGYSGYESLDDCILTLAKAYELSQMPQEAKATYLMFIELYPEHPLTDDLKRTVQLLDKGAVTPEEQLAAILSAE